jgi:hypothetical protein
MIAKRSRACALALAVFVLLGAGTRADAAATITIINTNAAGVGFNDATAAAPVGGNPGTTLGQQRLNVFQAAAAIWGANIDSAVPIRVDAAMTALTCTATAATLGSAGTTNVFSFSSGSGIFLNTWYPKALVNKFVGTDVAPSAADIRARFNINLGNTGCLTGTPFYLGLDNNHGTAIDLLTVLLHEFAHGLGMQAFTAQNGSNLGPPFYPSVYNHFSFDNTTGKSWDVMTDAERAASGINPRNVVWTGGNVTAQAPFMLQPGVPLLKATAPFGLAGLYQVGTASFGAALSAAGLSGEVMPLSGVGDQVLGCQPFSAINVQAVTNKIALIDRGVCGFTVKVANAQAAGARAVIIADNVAGGPPAGLGGADSTITIPAVRITLADGQRFKDALRFRSRTSSGVLVKLALDLTQINGTDPFGRVLLYTPNPYVGGSSVSHWDTSAFANLLMEPFFSNDLTHEVHSPFDLTLEALHDIGW